MATHRPLDRAGVLAVDNPLYLQPGQGAALRVSMPYLDPKIYDGGAYETAKYAERRDDMGRLMLAVMMQARQRIASVGTAAERTR